MIIGDFSNSDIESIQKLGDNFKEAYNWLKNNNMNDLAGGKHVISNAVYVVKQRYSTKPKKDGLFEAHKRYIDIQFLISGEEFVYAMNPNQNAKVAVEYSNEKDIMFYSANGMDKYTHTIRLFPGNFAIFYPDDWHMPCIMDENDGVKTVEKIVLKVLV
jgi:YhcH/YjgK/YiaL family protein